MSWNEDGFRMMPPPPSGPRRNINASNSNRQPTPPRQGQWRNTSNHNSYKQAMPPRPGDWRNNTWNRSRQSTPPRPYSWNRNDNSNYSNSNQQGMLPPPNTWRKSHNPNPNTQATSPLSFSWRNNNSSNSNQQAMPPPPATAQVETEKNEMGNTRNQNGYERSVSTMKNQSRGHANKRSHRASPTNGNSATNKRHQVAVKPEPRSGSSPNRHEINTSNSSRQTMPPPVATARSGVVKTEQIGMGPPPVRNQRNNNENERSVSTTTNQARGHDDKRSQEASSTNASSTTNKRQRVAVKQEPRWRPEEEHTSNPNRQVDCTSNSIRQVMPPPPPPARMGVVKTEQIGMGPPPVRNSGNGTRHESSVSTRGHNKKRSHDEASVDRAATAKCQHVVIDLLSGSDSEEEEDKAALEAHIIFVVDFSGSMNEKDIRKKNGKKMKRWDAVFDSINELVRQQVEENASSDAMVVVSLVIFNNDAETLLDKMPVVGKGQKVLKALETAHKAYKPKGGTGFAAGLERAKQLAQGSKGNVMVVFLSDGRPGDLNPRPPSDSSIPMQSTFRRCKQTYTAAGVHIEEMKANFQDRFNLQLICLFSEGKPWLEYLGQRYNGTFHMCELTLDDDNTPAPAVPSQARARAALKDDDSDDDDDSDYEEDEILEMKVKSHNTIIAERYARAKAAGTVVSIAATTQGSSIRSTFQSISSTVTAMRNGATRRPLQERQIKLENGTRSKMDTFPATRMVLKSSGDGVKNAPGEKSNGRLVKISQHPFAQGGLRNVFRMEEIGPAGCHGLVGKESRHEVRYAERLQFHLESSRCQAKAAEFAKFFNTANGSTDVSPIEVLCAEVYRLKDDSFPGGFRYLGVEEELRGTYEKWNSNNGFVLDADTPQNHVAQAFSHFSYEHSNQNEMVVDIQGSGYAYTDPQLHSKKKEYGRADRGESGFKDFFRTHKCNHICIALGLQKRENFI